MTTPDGVLTTEAAIDLSRYESTGLGDDGGYSALHRPGSWEWQLEGAARARGRLEGLGFREEEDPAAAWRVRWVRESPLMSDDGLRDVMRQTRDRLRELEEDEKRRS